MSRCEARQYSDEMICGRCGLRWDANDPDRPACRPRVAVMTTPAPARNAPDGNYWRLQALRAAGVLK